MALPKEVPLKLLDAVNDSSGAFEDGRLVDMEVGKCRLNHGDYAAKDKYLAFQEDNFFSILLTRISVLIASPVQIAYI